MKTEINQKAHRKLRLYEKYIKRAIDIVCSGLAILAFSWLYLILAVLVRIKMGSPVLFGQQRPGRIDPKTGKERIFKMYKFRSMTDKRDAEGNLLPDEVRLTKFGAWLRSTSLDELPELFNILKGDMSIIGPRPLLVKYLPYYTEEQRQRHRVRPGLTGYAQAHGRNGISWDEKLKMDVEYVQNITFLGDVKIIFDTVAAVLKREGISSETSATMEDFVDYVESKQKANAEPDASPEQPLVSVIVPIYGIERYIGICIESILGQTYRNLEVILVDDGSPDRCGEICDLYAQVDSRIRVIHKENGGLVSARKAGLAASTGAFVGYVDGDDWIDPGFYEALVTQMLANNADIVAAGHSRDLFSKSAHFYNSLEQGLYEGQKLEQLQKQMISYGTFYRPGITTYVWNKLFRREILWDHQMNVDERITIGEDGAVTYPALMACRRVYVLNNCDYHYRQREDSMLKKSASFQDEARRLRVLYEHLLKFAEKHPPAFQLREQITDYLLGICVMRSGGMLPDGESGLGEAPFGQDFQGKRVAIYSAGTFGQQLVNRFRENGYCSVVKWVDDDYWEYRRCCLAVDPVESITAVDADYVLVATVDYALAETIRERLLACGLNKNKILMVHCQQDSREELLCRYLY